MKKILACLFFSILLSPQITFAAVPMAKNQTLVGVVTKAYENVVVIKTSSAAVYTAQTC